MLTYFGDAEARGEAERAWKAQAQEAGVDLDFSAVAIWRGKAFCAVYLSSFCMLLGHDMRRRDAMAARRFAEGDALSLTLWAPGEVHRNPAAGRCEWP